MKYINVYLLSVITFALTSCSNDSTESNKNIKERQSYTGFCYV